MESFLSRKRPKISPSTPKIPENPFPQNATLNEGKEVQEEESTDLKLATLSSLFPTLDQATLLDLLISANGSVQTVSSSLLSELENASPRKKPVTRIGHQTSLSSFRKPATNTLEGGSSTIAKQRRVLTKKGQTLHLYTPEDIAEHTPCSIVHDFLPAKEADGLLSELLVEAETFERQTFKLFDNVVQSPHSACFYVDSLEECERQKSLYLYNGSYLEVCLLRFRSRACFKRPWLLMMTMIGRSPDHTANAKCFRQSSASCQRRDRKTHQISLPRRQEAQVSVTTGMDTQCGFR